ncbi:hypothetical protein OJF2_37000 [Aquisphaera giovannonii]|uniref:Phasin protein n=1 Tax=Aquisphaera giovannonii TaxID=406548 RepID=A0A5B9W4T7_9BACT|nr:hypothetical protein [Aquisphaera giovannonii]QEH35155.1 hypothetical protein OJF2_37000 [Aquisphaera giovannonii]
MFDVILENYRKAAESTMKMQQDMMRNWAMQWPQMLGGQGFGLPVVGAGSALPGAAWLEQMGEAQKKWAQSVTEMLDKHRESLDAQYRAGIRTIEDAFKVGQAKDPQQFQKLTEELWKQSFDCLKTVAEAQVRDVQTAMQKWYEAASKAAAGIKV